MPDTLKQAIGRLRSDSSGATAVEYGLIAAMIALALIVAISSLGASNQGSWASTAQKASNAMLPPSAP